MYLARTSFYLVAAIFLLLPLISLNAQELPGKIRGYKVYDVLSAGRLSAEKNGSDAAASDLKVEFQTPELVSGGISGLIFEIPVEIETKLASGRVDFLMFRDFTIDGIPVKIAEYNDSFTVRKGQPVILGTRVKLTIKPSALLAAGYRKLKEKENKWRVTGTVFVFGRFKRFGFGFKRVVPVRIDREIAFPFDSGIHQISDERSVTVKSRFK